MDREQSISPRELVTDIIEHGTGRKVPKGELCISDSVVRLALKCQQVGFEERRAFVDAFNLDIFTIAPVYPDFGKRLPSPAECLWPDLEKWTRQTSVFNFAILDGAFEWGLRVFGVEKFLLLPKTSPLALREFVKKIEALNIAVIKQLADQGINGVILADDIAINRGLMVSPKTLQQYFWPSIATQVEEIRSYKLAAFYHSDGDYRIVIEDIINAGFMGLHCLDRNAGIEVSELQSNIGNKLCLWGHLDVQDSNEACNPASLQQMVRSIQQMSQGRKFILGTNSGLFEGMNLSGIRTLYQSVNQG